MKKSLSFSRSSRFGRNGRSLAQGASPFPPLYFKLIDFAKESTDGAMILVAKIKKPGNPGASLPDSLAACNAKAGGPSMRLARKDGR